jgi:TolB-like protein/Tfp pilus assembly protein PilF
VISSPGDNVLAEFASVVDAVQCGVEIQQVLRAKNAVLPENRRVEFRIGINLGDVIEEEDSIYGDGVNIAARMESLAEAGGICISGSAYEQIENKLPLRYDYLGEHEVKNIAKPVRVYRVGIEPNPRTHVEAASREKIAFPMPNKPSIAVLPFVNMSSDPEQEYFSDGITEDLITDLSKISRLMVIARNSTFTYKGRAVKIKQVAEELGVQYVLEGSVRRAGDEIRINAQLIDALTGHHLWADRYDGTMGKIFALQDQITQKIVSALAIKLTGAEKQIITEKGTKNVGAYDEFLRGWVYYLRWTSDDLTKAVQSFKKAIELDSNYGRAYAALALAHWMSTYIGGLFKGFSGISRDSWLERRLLTRQYLKQGMKKPTSIAHHVNGLLHLFRRQHEEAISELERALTLDSNDPACNSGMGMVLYFSGRPKEAIEYVNWGMRLDPHNPMRYLQQLGITQFCMGNLEEAIALFEKARKFNPEIWGGIIWTAASYGLLGRKKDACLALEKYKKGWRGELHLPSVMYFYPFKDRSVADRFAEGLVKAGVKGQPSGYFPTFKENQLTGEEIKSLLFGSKNEGISWEDQQWWVERKKNGEIAWHGGGPIPFDTGKSWIERDLICNQYQKRFWGIESCGTVFRNPKGTHEGKDEYVICWDYGFRPFSLVR